MVCVPYYVYVCLDFHKEFTQVLHITDLTTIRLQCPHCGSETVEQKVA